MNEETKTENLHVRPADGKPPVVGSASYRQSFGLDNPPKGELLKLKYAEGIRYYLLWIQCPDNENIIEGWFPTKSSALKYAKDNDWVVS